VSYYTGTSGATDPASIVTVAAGSKLVFESDANQPPHTASGLGSSGFPTTFDNTGGTNATGTTIDGGTSWSTGTLQSGTMSSVFTVGPPGDYYFGCFYHFVSSGMRDVIVSH
jgi:plastocyanin